ncbi:MAG: hypothetical protein SV765_12255 [Pseudomonadota bacterium]|nr:hypothetical protein [Pseudomonadota bacterium]
MIKRAVFSLALLMSLGCQADTANSGYTVVTQEQMKSFTGRAIYTTEQGAYIGELKNGNRHGYGISYAQNGSVMAGHWENDKFMGEGVMISMDINSVSVGNFDGASLIGDGAITFEGDVAKGDFKKGSAMPENVECYRAGERIDCKGSKLYSTPGN